MNHTLPGPLRTLAAALALLATCLVLPAAAHAAPSPETKTFASPALDGARRTYLVHLPPGYDPAAKRLYPVVYLLHGLGGEPRDWFRYADVGAHLDALVAAREVAPMILVAPDGDNGYWTDHLPSPDRPGPRWGTYVAADLVAEVEREYRADPARRAIVGASMGGHGAMSIGLMHPDRFDAVVSLAGALFDATPTHRGVYRKVWGEPGRLNDAHWQATSPIALMRRLDPKGAPALYLQCGDDDKAGFLEHAIQAHQILLERGVPHELRVADGGHVWATWASATDDWMRFVDRSLKKARRR